MTNKELRELLKQAPDDIEVDIKHNYYVGEANYVFILNGRLTISCNRLVTYK